MTEVSLRPSFRLGGRAPTPRPVRPTGWKRSPAGGRTTEDRDQMTEGSRQGDQKRKSGRKTSNIQLSMKKPEARSGRHGDQDGQAAVGRRADTPAKEGPNLTGNVSNHLFTHLGIDPQPATDPGQNSSASKCSTARWPAKDMKEIFRAGCLYWASRSDRQSHLGNISLVGRI